LLKEELDTITSIDIVDEYEAFTLDELEFENDVGQQELVGLRCPSSGSETRSDDSKQKDIPNNVLD
jgi:hypothetical protein